MRATVTGTTSGSVIGARSTYHTPSANSATSWAATLYGEPGLADTAGAGQSDEPVVHDDPAQFVHFGLASNKRGELCWKIVRRTGFGRAQGWELVAQVGVTELHHALGPRQIAQRVGAEIGQPRIGREPVEHQIACRAGQHGLAAVRQIAQPRGAVDGRADVVALVASAARRRCARRCAAGSDPRVPLQLQRTRHGVAGTSEHDHKTVALALFDRPHPAMGGDDIRQGAVELRDRSGHLLRPVVPQPREPSTSAISSVTVPVGSNSLTPRSLPLNSGVSPRDSISLMLGRKQPHTP